MKIGGRDAHPVHTFEDEFHARLAAQAGNRHAVNVPAGCGFGRVVIGMRIEPKDDKIAFLIARTPRHRIDRPQGHAVIPAHEDREFVSLRDFIGFRVGGPGPSRDL